jgi:hypothetical protein
MKLLDELMEEARRIRAKEIRLNAELEAQSDYYNAQLLPVMLRSHDYFAAVIENLNIVAPDVHVRYPLNPQLEHGVSLKQSLYKFRADNKENPRQIDIFCRCTLEKPHEFYLSSPKQAQAHADLLDSYDFAYHRKNRLDRHHDISGATFILEGPMMAHIRMTAHPADKSIRFVLRNIEHQPVKRYSFAPDAVDEALLENVAKVLLRRIPRLVERKVDSTLRARLQDRIAHDRDETAQDIAQAYAEREAAKLAEKKSGLVDRAKFSAREFLKRIRSG